MNIVCYVMMRNESPILDPFLDQLEAFFDFCIIVDHDSTDDSVEKIRSRKDLNNALYHLKSPGYPQAAIATYFARNLLSNGQADALFFLDCDEFLPFKNRTELESFLLTHSSADVIRLNWLNCCGTNFDSDNIFAGTFERAKDCSPIQKIILHSSVLNNNPDFSVMQGYHSISEMEREGITVFDCNDMFLLHIPVQSRTQVAIKLVNGHNRLIRESINLERGLGYHWVDSARELSRLSFKDTALRNLALGYPDFISDCTPESVPLVFDFPYIHSSYDESTQHVSAQIAGLMELDTTFNDSETSSFILMDSEGEVILTSSSNLHGTMEVNTANDVASERPFVVACGTLGEDYSALIEPLLNLPTKLPVTAWQGHIPFMFVLFKLLEPKIYVELGVHLGASFIAACTAAKSYNIRCQLFGVDTWEGDDHVGHYNGDHIYNELKEYIYGTFPTARLVRDLFSVARSSFSVGSVELLHIDGLHTYDAVKNDFATWIGAMAPSGVVMFHDISVYERGFGVHRFWVELKEHFSTMEFHHSHGLGVLFLDPDDQRIAYLRAISRDEQALQLYSDFVADIAGTLGERMGYYSETAEQNAELVSLKNMLVDCERSLNERQSSIESLRKTHCELQAELERVHNRVSWKVTKPLRWLRGFLK